LQGAMFMIVSSGLLTALLFYLIGSIKERTQTSLIPSLGGLSTSMPMLSGFLLVAALGSLGLPLTSGFISEIQAFIGGFDTYPAISFVGVLGVILSAVYLLYAMQKTTFGPTQQAYVALADATPREYVPAVVLTVLVLVVGIFPNVIGQLFNLSVQALLRIGG
jgi:NADH-quinone oxidoreductase subunit M